MLFDVIVLLVDLRLFRCYEILNYVSFCVAFTCWFTLFGLFGYLNLLTCMIALFYVWFSCYLLFLLIWC